MAHDVGAAGQRASELGDGGPCAAQGNAGRVETAVDGDPDEAADLVAARPAAQHLGDVDAPRLALQVEGE